MQLPDAQRVIYGKNPLVGVTCQLDFPAILLIDTEAPAAFQELIRQQYPVFQENRGIELPPQLGNVPIRLGSATYGFLDNTPGNEVWTVSLTKSTLALSTSKYLRWEDFRAHLDQPLQAFVDTYSPAFFTRVGLRYQDVIRRSVLGIDSTPWKDLLKPQIVGMFSVVEDEDAIESSQTLAIVELGTDRKARLQHGLLIDQATQERCYLIDTDFYAETQTEINDARNILDSIHEVSGKFFRWCITDRLHTALEPKPI